MSNPKSQPNFRVTGMFGSWWNHGNVARHSVERTNAGREFHNLANWKCTPTKGGAISTMHLASVNGCSKVNPNLWEQSSNRMKAIHWLRISDFGGRPELVQHKSAMPNLQATAEVWSMSTASNVADRSRRMKAVILPPFTTAITLLGTASRTVRFLHPEITSLALTQFQHIDSVEWSDVLT